MNDVICNEHTDNDSGSRIPCSGDARGRRFFGGDQSISVCEGGGGSILLFLAASGFARLAAVFLVLIFSLAGANKAAYFSEFVQDISAQGIIPNQITQPLAGVLISLEFILAGWLLLKLLQGGNNLRRPLAGYFVAFLFFIGYAFFMTATSENAGVSSSCGCGLPFVGNVNETWQSVIIRNGVFAGLTILAFALDRFAGQGINRAGVAARVRSVPGDLQGSVPP